MAKKSWKKTGKSRRRQKIVPPTSSRIKTYEITAHGSSDLEPAEEIENVYNFIRNNPGLVKSQIIKRHNRMGMTRKRFWARWATIRDYLRDVKPNNLDRLNPDGQPWIYGEANTPAGKRMRYYAVDPSIDFIAAPPVTVAVEYERKGLGLARLAEKAVIPVIDKPVKKKLVDRSFGQVWTLDTDAEEDLPCILEDKKPYMKTEEVKEPSIPIEDYVIITYRGVRIEVPPGESIRLD